MNNRKLFGALSILVLAALFMLMGCGDGKRDHKTPIRKSFAGGNPGGPASQKDIKEKADKITTIKATLDMQTKSGEAISQQNLEAGTYTIDEVLAYESFILSGQEAVALNQAKVSNRQLVPMQNPSPVGLIANDIDPERLIETPNSFTVQAGGTIPPVSPDQSNIYKLQLNMSAGTSKLELSAVAPTGQKIEVSVLAMLASGADAKSAYILKLSNGSDANLTIRKIDGGIRFILSVGDKGSKKGSAINKQIVLTYKRAGAAPAASAPAANTQGTNTPPAANTGAAPAAPATNSGVPPVPPQQQQQQQAPPQQTGQPTTTERFDFIPPASQNETAPQSLPAPPAQ